MPAVGGARKTVDPEEKYGRERTDAPAMGAAIPATGERPCGCCEDGRAGRLIANPPNRILEVLHLVSTDLMGLMRAVFYGEWGPPSCAASIARGVTLAVNIWLTAT